MKREHSYTITEKQYNYLLPVFGIAYNSRTRLLNRVVNKVDHYYFIGTHEDYKDMLNRCKYLED